MTSGPPIKLIWSYFMAELVATFVFVMIGDGSVAAYVLTKQKIDIFVVCLAFGIGAMVATYTAARISGAHINPAATLAFALDGRIRWCLVPVYILAQYLGGFLAALVLYANYSEAISSIDGGIRSAYGSTNSTGQIFATYPGPWISAWGALVDQIVGTALLLFSLSAVTDKNNSGLEERHQPIVVALVIGFVCIAFNPNCGAIFNPARDLAPRLLSAFIGYSEPSVWAPVQGLYWLLAGLIGPHLGAILGVFSYKLFIGGPLAIKQRYEQSKGHDSGVAGLEHQHLNLQQPTPPVNVYKQPPHPVSKLTSTQN